MPSRVSARQGAGSLARMPSPSGWQAQHDADYRESFGAFRERVDAAFDATVEATTGRTLVVTSAGCVSQIAARLTAAGSLDAWKEFALSISNTSVSRVALGKERARLQTFNEVSHLDAAGLVTLR